MSDKVRPAIQIEHLRKRVLNNVEERLSEKPALSIENLSEKLKPILKKKESELDRYEKIEWEAIQRRFSKALEGIETGEFSKVDDYVREVYYHADRLLKKFSLEEIIYLNYSSIFSPIKGVERMQKMIRPWWLIRKIELSAWHWSGKTDWNFIADTYNSLVKFDLGLKDFSVKVDTSSHCNNRGYSKYTRTFLDAELAYIIEYKGEHVLTVGFNTCCTWKDEKRIIEIRQIQCKNKKGNRWMYKMGDNYVEFILKKFIETFKGYSVQLISASKVIENITHDYQKHYDYHAQKMRETLECYRKDGKWLNDFAEENFNYHADQYEDWSVLLFNFKHKDIHRIKKIYGQPFPSVKRYGHRRGLNYVKIAA